MRLIRSCEARSSEHFNGNFQRELSRHNPIEEGGDCGRDTHINSTPNFYQDKDLDHLGLFTTFLHLGEYQSRNFEDLI